jgi:cytidylate kinase
MSFKIAVDGPAASGKGTLAKTLAMALSYDYLDTGTLYRAVALGVQQAELTVNNTPEAVAEIVKIATHLALPIMADDAFRTSEIAQIASKIAAMPEVRQALVDKQRDFANSPPSGKGAILDGRDIGSVILPDADVKLYIDADINVRAKRRFLELFAKDDSVTQAQILADLTERDARDKTRETATLKPAADAFIIDTTQLSAQEVLQAALNRVKSL